MGERSILILGGKIKLPRKIIGGNRVSLTVCDITCVYEVKTLLVVFLVCSMIAKRDSAAIFLLNSVLKHYIRIYQFVHF